MNKTTSYEIDISICIANFNGNYVLMEAINSILAQKTSRRYEIIVHDDFSTDNAMAEIDAENNNIITIFSKTNVGFCVANNRMVDRARGKYILLLNNDAVLFPDAIEVFFENANAIEGSPILGLPQYCKKSGELIDAGSWYDYGLNVIPNLAIKTEEVGLIVGACLWIEKKVWVKIGGFPECFESLAEDTYLCLAAKIYKHPVIILGKSGFFHVVGHSLGGGKLTSGGLVTSKKRRCMTERNKLLVILACYPFFFLLIILPIHLIIFLVEGLIVSIISRDGSIFREVYIKALAGFIKNIDFSLLARGRFKAEPHSLWRVFQGMKPVPRKLVMLLKYGLPKLY